jgi:hypothetical protein
MLTAARWFGALMLLGAAWTVLGLPAVGMVLAARAAPTFMLSAPMTLREEGARQVAGRCFREQVGNLIHVHLEGRHEDFGYAEGLLVGDRVALIERDMMAMFIERVPSFVARHLILGFVNWNDIDLDSGFSADELREIAAITAGHHELHDPYLAVSPSYARGLQYHALHDISQYLIDNPLVHPPQVGCTAVSVKGTRSADGHLLVGRLFDFEGGRRFDLDKIVYTVAPEGGHRFVSVSWGGMSGAVTGLNDAGLWVSLNAAATDRQRFSGRPIVMVVREVLEHCATIDEALAVIGKADVFVSDGVLLASGRENRCVVAERGPGGLGVREMSDDRLVLTNHFLTDTWKSDAANAKRVSDGTTAARFARAEELLAARERHDPASILALCRDHRGAHGVGVGFGNRSTINAWIGAHLVVADVSAGLIWVCEPSHGLGRALAFDVNGPRPDVAALPSDPELAFEEEHGEEYRRLVEDCNAQLRARQRPEAARTAQRLLALNPNGFEANALAADASDNPAKRRELLERARSLQPAYRADRERIDKLLAASAAP